MGIWEAICLHFLFSFLFFKIMDRVLKNFRYLSKVMKQLGFELDMNVPKKEEIVFLSKYFNLSIFK